MMPETPTQSLHSAYEDFRSVVAALPDDLFLEKIRNWAPRDVAAHLIGWNRYVVEGCERLRRGEPPGYLADGANDYATVNADSVRRYTATEREGVLADLDASWRELEAYLAGLPPEAWDADFGVRVGRRPVTITGTVRSLARDYIHHAEHLRAWARRRGVGVPQPLRLSPLHSRHAEAGARMVPFAGWEMPVQYVGIVAEHRAVRSACGIFDVSHMGEFWITGPGALATLDRLLCNDPRRLEDGQAMYTPMCDERGGILDDLLVYRFAADRFLLVVNAARHDADWEWVRSHAYDCHVRDGTYRTGLLALQGPRSEALLQPLVDTDLSALDYYRFARSVAVAGVPAMVSRTGYTGEDGFEILTGWYDAQTVWDAVVQAGAQPCGLGARDTLRLEAGYLLYGNDMDESTTPLEAGLGWTVTLRGRDFVGADALRRQKIEGVGKRLCGFVVRDRAIARHGSPILHKGERVGTVTSGSYGPWIDKNIALGYVPPAIGQPGTEVMIEVRGRHLAAETTKLPFYRRPRA